MAPLTQPDPAIWTRNLEALAEFDAALCEHLTVAPSPDDLQFTLARDGTPTFRWCDVDGGIAWLGRTTMPRIRGESLAEIFQPGTGNVAVLQAGQGCLIRSLLNRIHAIQAVFVIEPSTADLKLILTLHDFATDIRTGRLCVFAGDAAWDDVETFLRRQSGYWTPDRIVSWPWFTPQDIAEVTNRLSRISAEIAAQRHAEIDEVRQQSQRDECRLLVLAPDPGGEPMARGVARAAEQLGWIVRNWIVDQPARRHPSRMARVMLESQAQQVVLVHATRDQLPEPLPDDARVYVWMQEESRPSAEWLGRLHANDCMIVPHVATMGHLKELGFDAARVRCVPPAGDVTADVADCPPLLPVEAGDVGLNMSSHESLWNAAAQLRERNLTPWSDEHAEPLLKAAETQSGVRLTSDEVRAAILQRIRAVLGPGVERNAYARVWREAFPQASSTAALVLPPEGRVCSALLDAAACGRVVFVRAYATKDADGWDRFLDPRAHVQVFSTPRELAALLRAYQLDPSEAARRAVAACEHVRAHHTMLHRMQGAFA